MASPTPDSEDLATVFREAHGLAVANLTGAFRDLSLAEDAVQDAFVVAAERWPVDGMPPNPTGWIITTARRRNLSPDQGLTNGSQARHRLRGGTLSQPSGMLGWRHGHVHAARRHVHPGLQIL